jgi:uncharacterized membrane protein
LGALALIPFVAIPFPVAGAWTDCVAVFVFVAPPRYAFMTAVAVLITCTVVTSVVAGAARLITPV